MQGIYSIKNLVTNQLYIGSAININNRFRTHLCNLRKNKHENLKLQRSWNKYGESNFRFQAEEIVENKKDLVKIEQEWFNVLWESTPLFNICKEAGSRLGTSHSDETKEQIRKKKLGQKHSIDTLVLFSNTRKKENNSFYGKKHTKESKEKMSHSRNPNFSPFKGKKHTEEAKLKNAQARLGKKMSESTKQKMRESQRKRRLTEKEAKYEKE